MNSLFPLRQNSSILRLAARQRISYSSTRGFMKPVSRFALAAATAAATPPAAADPVATLVGRLDLERYKATIKGLTRFGDRRQGTTRNRAAVDWIEAQLTSYGRTPTER